jgi:Fe-S oxidoreductase
MLPQARKAAENALAQLQFAVAEGLPIVGVEPSAILGFRDEFPKLVSAQFREAAAQMSGLAQTFEEFIYGEREDGRITREQFTQEEKTIHLHLHCHQKSLSHIKYSKAVLSLPTNYKIRVIPSGCCGMAGSFGYEAEHYNLSMQIGEMVLFPAVRQVAENEIVVASGTSCRHQIADGTKRTAVHPAIVLLKAMI